MHIIPREIQFLLANPLCQSVRCYVFLESNTYMNMWNKCVLRSDCRGAYLETYFVSKYIENMYNYYFQEIKILPCTKNLIVRKYFYGIFITLIAFTCWPDADDNWTDINSFFANCLEMQFFRCSAFHWAIYLLSSILCNNTDKTLIT